MKKLIFALCALSFVCAGCSDEDGSREYVNNPMRLETRAGEIVGKTNEMAWELLRWSATEEENTIVSPFSLATCLAMLDNGAAGETDKQIRDFLGFGDFSQEEFNACFKYILKGMPEVDTSVEFTTANSLWHKKELSPKPEFTSLLKNNYEAETFAVDFTERKTLTEINGWCSEKTNKLVPKFLEEINPQTAYILLNAIYFKGFWNKEFKVADTKSDFFTKSNGEKVKAEFMHKTEEQGAYLTDKISMISLPMGKFMNFRTFFILPDEGVSIEEAIEDARGAFEKTWERLNVEMAIPKFKVETNKSLKETLKQNGLATAFDDGDFSKMFSNGDVNLDDVRQACSFSINEKEVKAAAVTSASGNFMSPPPVDGKLIFNLNRPFIFGLRENSSKTLLFLGVIQEPKE